MIPNNNLSVLPWYTSIEQQNARKWWIYNRVYPLFTPAGFLLPFQVMRDAMEEQQFVPVGDELEPVGFEQGVGIAVYDEGGGLVSYDLERYDDGAVAWWDLDGSIDKLYFSNLPAGADIADFPANILFVDRYNTVIAYYNLTTGGVSYNGGIDVPADAVRVYVQTELDGLGDASVYEATTETIPVPVAEFNIYTKDGILVGDFSNEIIPQIAIKNKGAIDVIIYAGELPFTPNFANGQYYAVMADGTNTWYSEIFTVVNDIAPYLKIEWWDLEDFIMDSGVIVYDNPKFKNVLYLDADIAKPEYVFEEEGETRDCYFFPVKQISEKRYRFNFLASEYLLDVMRFIRMADFAEIEYHGQRYNLDTFLITPEWEDNGDVAAVEAEFETATVAKKIGTAYNQNQL